MILHGGPVGDGNSRGSDDSERTRDILRDPDRDPDRDQVQQRPDGSLLLRRKPDWEAGITIVEP